ncbi:unnamed protein product [Gadus morhua 'NCC']
MDGEEQSDSSLRAIAIVVLCCGAVKMLHLMGVISVEDKVDDDLEMTMVCHRPEGLGQLEALTNFNKREPAGPLPWLQERVSKWWVNEDTFKQYTPSFPHGDATPTHTT